MDEPSQLFLRGCQGRRREGGQLEARRLSSGRAVPDRLEERRHHEAGRYGGGFRLARQRRHELGTLPGGHLVRRQKAVLRASCRYRRRRKNSCGGGAVMRGFLVAVVVATICLPLPVFAQRGVRSTGATPAKGAVPRTPDGKPDLTGVWQGGSTQR